MPTHCLEEVVYMPERPSNGNETARLAQAGMRRQWQLLPNLAPPPSSEGTDSF